MEIKQHIAGYQGYIPQRKFGSIEPRAAENPTADIPGYAGYIWAYKPENVYGKTFTQMSKDIKCTSKFRDRDNYDEMAQSIYKESFIKPKEMDQMHNEAPSRNKFKIRRNHDINAENQMAKDCRSRVLSTEKLNQSKMAMAEIRKKMAEEARPDLRLMQPIVGYGAHNRQVSVGNIHKQDWQICRSLAKDRVAKNYEKQQNKDQDPASSIPKNNFQADVVSVSSASNFISERRPYKTFYPVSGYQGFIKRVQADNIMGCTYQQAVEDSKKSVDKLRYYNSLNSDAEKQKSLPNQNKRKSNRPSWK